MNAPRPTTLRRKWGVVAWFEVPVFRETVSGKVYVNERRQEVMFVQNVYSMITLISLRNNYNKWLEVGKQAWRVI